MKDKDELLQDAYIWLMSIFAFISAVLLAYWGIQDGLCEE
jgi:hypothetical protein